MDPYSLESQETDQQQGFHALLRFLRVIRRHKAILISFAVAAAFLAVVSHKRTPKQYESSAKLMVRQLQSATTEYNPRAENMLLLSYRQLLLSDNVLIGAVKELEQMPPELAGNTNESYWPRALRGMLTVDFEPAGTTLEVRCRSHEPEATVAVIEALTTASAKFMDNFQQNEATEAVKRLEERRENVELKLFAKETELLQARKASGEIIVNEGSDESHPLVQRVNDLNQTLTQARNRRLELQSMLESAKRLVSTNSDLTLALQKLESLVGKNVMSQLPGMSGSNPDLLQQQKTELAQLQTELNALRRHFGSQHPEIKRREGQLGTLQRQIQLSEHSNRQHVSIGMRDPEVGRWLITTIEAELQTSNQYELALTKEYNAVEQSALRLSENIASIQLAERQVDILRQSHSSILNRLNAINIQPDGGLFKVAPLTEPYVPGSPVYPVLSRTLGTYVMFSIILAMCIIYVLDMLDDRLGSPEEVREELGLSVLGVIRRLPEEETQDCRIYVQGHPQTPHAECFRTLKTSITLSPMDTKCLAVTSTEASEGKTTTIVNLAASYAQTGLRTLLIDADMRRPGLSRLLEVRGQGGLSEVLKSESNISQMCTDRIVKTEVDGLEVLPCGPRILNAGMLLSMPALAEILDWAVSEYDQVIVDCPPTLPVSDAAIVGRYVDGLLFLMNPDKTHRRSVVRAVDQLRAMDLKIVGVVANTSLSEDKNSYGYQYGYGYGYGSEYAYGHDEENIDNDDEASDLPRFERAA